MRSADRWQGAVGYDDDVMPVGTVSARLAVNARCVEALRRRDVLALLAVERNGGLWACLQWVMSQTQPVPES